MIKTFFIDNWQFDCPYAFLVFLLKRLDTIPQNHTTCELFQECSYSSCTFRRTYMLETTKRNRRR